MKRFDREEIEKMKYVAENLMTFFNAVCLSLSGFLPLVSSCVSLFCPFWVSACLSNSPPSGTPHHPSKVHSNSAQRSLQQHRRVGQVVV